MVVEVVEVVVMQVVVGLVAELAERLSEDEEAIILPLLSHNLPLPILVQVEAEVEELEIL
jgi:hypothetical protein